MTRPAAWGTLLLSVAALPAHAEQLTLAAQRTAAPLQIDGAIDSAWQEAAPLKVRLDQLTYEPSAGYPGIPRTDLELRSLYDDQYVYFLFRWRDPTRSQARWPWEKQQDGSWQQRSNRDSTGHENFNYEDKLSVAWNISEKGFAKKGCEQSCHIGDNGKIDDIPDTSAGRHFTAGPGQTLDVWHWKSARTNPVEHIDDQVFDHSRAENKDWGRKSDEASGGGYQDNIANGLTVPSSAAGQTPAWMNRDPHSQDRYWILDEDKVPFVDTFKPGDLVAGVIAKAYEGSRGDIQAKGVWKDGYWTLEAKRLRVTNWPLAAQQDVQFDDPAKVHHLGVGIFDNSQINHFFHAKAIEYRLAR